jgi:hypothetical protein|eukprot:COSAG06_NODE_7727_length_2397_cov_1.511749_2_plen_81_part_00
MRANEIVRKRRLSDALLLQSCAPDSRAGVRAPQGRNTPASRDAHAWLGSRDLPRRCIFTPKTTKRTPPNYKSVVTTNYVV